MRIILILVLTVIGLALIRLLVGDVAKAVSRAIAGGEPQDQGGKERGRREAGRLVRDPQTGSYVDEQLAVKATVDGRTFFFESEASRDAYMRKQRS